MSNNIRLRSPLLDVRYLQREGSDYLELDDGKGSFSSSYRNLDSNSKAVRHPIVAPVGMWKIPNGETYAFPKFPLIRAQGVLMLPPRNESGPYNLYPRAIPAQGFQVLKQNAEVVLARVPKKSISVDACAYVGTRSPRNWSHWLINFLPGVMVADNFFSHQAAPPLVVGPGFRDGEARSSLFDYFWPDRETLLCEKDEMIRSREVFWFEQPYSDSPRPTSKGNLKPKFANFSIMKEFRRKLLEFASDVDSDRAFPEKIFLARESAMSRTYNQEEVEAVAIDAGYEVVYLNRLPIAQQIAVVSNADRIVGPTGSAFASTIVAKSGAKLLELSSITKNEKGEDWYAPLANIAGAEYVITFGHLHFEKASRRISLDTRMIAQALSTF